jgi:microcystin-dependent protein
MPDTYTANLSLTLPEIGASRDSWGAKTNDNWNVVDEFLAMAMPIGAVLDFAGTAAPDGWLICDGRLISRTTYSQLFAVLGTAWGAGDGSTTFRLPPTSGRASVGPGNVIDEVGNTVNFTFAQIRGAVARPIAQGHLPATIIATDVQGWHGHSGVSYAAGAHAHSTDVQGYHSHGGTTDNTDRDHNHPGDTNVQGDHQHHIVLPYRDAATSGIGSVMGAGGSGYTVMGAAVGSDPYSTDYVTDITGAHQHHFTTNGQSSGHLHAIYGDGSHGHNISAVGDHQHNLAIYGDGNHQHTITLGSGMWFDIMAPVVVVTKIIYAGSQASSRSITGAAAGAGPTRHLAAPSRGRH